MTQPVLQNTPQKQPQSATNTPRFEPVSRFRIPDENELPADLQHIYSSFRKHYGFIPNWLRALSVNPATAVRLVKFYEHLFDPAHSHLSNADRELVAVVASAANQCSYCVFNHTQSLGIALADRVRAQRIAVGHHHVQLNAREHALAEITDRLTRAATTVDENELSKLRALGFSEAAVLEVLEVAAFFNYANRLTIALNVLPDPQFFTHDTHNTQEHRA
jgi:uncharacterized peroxidase-related enzyme